MTQVDNCESQQELAYKLNVTGSSNVAKVCQKYNIRLLAISTDYVFNGSLDRPYNEDDIPDGGNTIYGQTKFQGEEEIRKICSNHLILRVSWLYGFGGPSFVHTMLNLAKAGKDNLKVVNDQRGNPTSVSDLAHHILKLITTEYYGTYHGTCNGDCTWYDFTCEIMRMSNIDIPVHPCTTAEFPRPAKRPAYSCLDNAKFRETVGDEFRDWKVALKEFLDNLKGENI
jgi:dTDP-4-dehydrorhamnose reductase